jgi:hypothetical protein
MQSTIRLAPHGGTSLRIAQMPLAFFDERGNPYN